MKVVVEKVNKRIILESEVEPGQVVMRGGAGGDAYLCVRKPPQPSGRREDGRLFIRLTSNEGEECFRAFHQIRDTDDCVTPVDSKLLVFVGR